MISQPQSRSDNIDLYYKKIELECGECKNIQGFKNIKNSIKTSKFNIYNMVPKLLIIFMSRYCNIVIIILGIIIKILQSNSTNISE